jgi:hypothetical protein
MVVNRKHIPWALLVLSLSAVASILYLANFHPESLPFPIQLPPFFGEVPPAHGSVGGTPLGLIFGLAGLALFIFAALLGVRKKKRLWPIGRVEMWLRGHIWLSILTIPLVLLHAGFKSGGPMTQLLLFLYAVVMLSGFYGLALQQFMPGLMTRRLASEVIYEEIPYLRKQLAAAAGKLHAELQPKEQGSAKGEAVIMRQRGLEVIVKLIENEVLPYLRSAHGGRSRLARQQASDDIFRLLKMNISDAYAGTVDSLQTWCDERRRMDLQIRMHHWLHGWLFVHIPVSVLLLMLTVWHAAATVFFFN